MARCLLSHVVSQEEPQDIEGSPAAVKDAARTVSARFVTFVTAGAYIALTVASTSDEMLVKGTHVNLPIVNTEIPIAGTFGFYTLVPWLVVALHLDRMLQLSNLASRLTDLEARMTGLDAPARARVRSRLPALPYVQFFLADADKPVQTVVAGLVVCGSMIVVPLLLLFWIQYRFLALRDPISTFSQGMAVVADVLLILVFLWPPIVERDARRVRNAIYRVPTRGLVLFACAAVCVFAVLNVIPDDTLPWNVRPSTRGLDLPERILVGTTLDPETINMITDGNVRQREQELAKVLRQSFMQGRDLRDANLFHAVLVRLDLRSKRDGEQIVAETRLQGADLEWARMEEVLLDDANLQRARLAGVQLEGASLMRAKCNAAELDGAELQRANFDEAVLSKASLNSAKLQGASLVRANLQGAKLAGAQLQGANLHGARLQDTDLTGASLDGADLTGAQLEGATLSQASLRGAILDSTLIDSNTKREKTCFDLTARVRVEHDGCCDAPCLAPDDPAFHRKRVDFMKALACADAYAARGIANQALRGADADSVTLMRVLQEARNDPTCDGVSLIPEDTFDQLTRVHADDVQPVAQRTSSSRWVRSARATAP
jgi:uncharacterized protein YjbI with pentapeptide repeats